ncbi:MAG: TAXI family TRAP transporter solute-binding subunit [Deltaproteobacteria bacterium]|nr:TAXI family TRAP transporter solute-binding subunit [Candidatus Zymogenaceae bacterium]
MNISMKGVRFSIVFIVIFACSCMIASAQDGEDVPLRLAVGEAGSFFWLAGKQYEPLWEEAGVMVDVVTSGDDTQSLTMLLAGDVDMALVPGPVLDVAAGNETDTSSVVAVAPVWPGTVHILITRKKEKTGTISDVKGKRIFQGDEGSWQHTMVDLLFESAGIRTKRLMSDMTMLELIDVMADFINTPLDGAVVLGAVPNPLVDDILRKTGHVYHLIPITGEETELIKASGMTVFPLTVAEGLYPYQREDFITAGYPQFLVSRSDLDEEAARTVAEVLLSGFPESGGNMPRLDASIGPYDPDTYIVPLHPAVRDLF